MAYLAAVAAHPGYVARFKNDLVSPGLHIPLAADGDLFTEAVALGREIVWLHTFGERFADASEGRPTGPPPVEDGRRPTIPASGAIPPDADEISYDSSERRLHVGTGYIENVPPEVWTYEVSGKSVLKQWFSYRQVDRSRPIIANRRPPSPLNDIQSEGWLPEYTTELINVLNVLTRLVALEPAQADLLARICDGPTLESDTLRAAGAFDAPTAPKKGKNAGDPNQISMLG